MAIQEKDGQQPERQEPQRAQPAGSAAPRSGNTFSFHSGGMFAAPIGVGVGSEYYGKVKAGLTEIYKTANENVEIALIDLDRANTPALAFSAIVVALRFKQNPKAGVAYHIIVLEATGDKLTPVFENIGNQQIELTRYTSDAMDDVLQAKAEEKVRKAFPTNAVHIVDGTVVPASFNPDDKYAMHRLALNAGLAAGTELETNNEGFADLNLVHMQNDSTMQINIGFNRQQIEDAVGNPMRSDALINFVSKKNGQQQQRNVSVNSGDKETKVSEVSGFVDLLWNPVNPAGQLNPYQQQMQMAHTQKYAARLVITNLASNFSYTPGSVLLALMTAMALRDDSNWIQAFRPLPSSGNEIDLTDIGALNIEANLRNEPNGYGTRIDTKSDNFKLEDLGQLVAAMVQPGLIVSLDCPEGGPQSWYLSVFAAASAGHVGAQDIIYSAANQLTNGNFGQFFPKGSAMFVDQNNVVHLGTWIDRNGVKRDIRDIDHIAVANLVGERNPQLIRDWSDTWLRTNYPLAQRLAARKKMISGLTNETATFTGKATRVTFSAAFLDAVSKGIRATGLPVRVNTPLSGSDFNNQRGVASFANSALLAPGQSFQAAPQFYTQSAYMGGGNFGGRYGSV